MKQGSDHPVNEIAFNISFTVPFTISTLRHAGCNTNLLRAADTGSSVMWPFTLGHTPPSLSPPLYLPPSLPGRIANHGGNFALTFDAFLASFLKPPFYFMYLVHQSINI